ncbi:MAG: hypothetical protein ACR2LL_13355 [Nitrosopumilus sp.]|uniref:hypothetical protein n=1 Tax=Nitrosopumilus sp. TaxID=2024843 RepID=UPI00292ED8D1|nr:hypothetical protein [Nitrosopumilus sp.]
MNWKKSLVERLGNKCQTCGLEDIEQIDIDFINGQEYLEDQYFENEEERCVWFVLHFKEESEYVQAICNSCKSQKKEDKSIPLSKLEEFYFTPTAMDAQEIMRWMDKKAEELLAFLRTNKQFVPIERRLERHYGDLRDKFTEIDRNIALIEYEKKWLPKRFAEVIEQDLDENPEIKNLVSKHHRPKIPDTGH